MKKISLISLIIVGAVTIGCAVLKYNDDATNRPPSVVQAEKVWQQKNPQLFSNAGYLKELEESAPKVANLPESLVQLRGVSTNPFGIRDDILQYIFTNIPESNESATRAAIKMMQYMQQIYYGDLTESEVMAVHEKEVLSFSCLVDYLDGNSSAGIQNIRSSGNIMKKMRDTKSRDEYSWAVDKKYFSWKVLGTGLTIAEEQEACEKGEF